MKTILVKVKLYPQNLRPRKATDLGDTKESV